MSAAFVTAFVFPYVLYFKKANTKIFSDHG